MFPFEVVARCEVIDLPANVAPRTVATPYSQTPQGQQEADYLVVPDESHVAIRSLLLFPVPQAGHSSKASGPLTTKTVTQKATWVAIGAFAAAALAAAWAAGR